uniref:Ssu-2 homolog n=1 Tax=Sander lucioperca TaxID=283035 RepID=A0A8C9X9E1_SANLU
APPPGWLDDVHGYQVPKGGESFDVARDALLKFVESKWRYSSKPARNLTFKELKPVTVYRYRLETYTETRTSAWQFESYNGQVVDGPQFGMSPPPWDIPVTLPARYTDKVEKVRVPHSSFVKPCHKCNGCGRTRCGNCHGRGQVRCVLVLNYYSRAAKTNRLRCTFCHGHGRSRDKCSSCHGQGYKTCSLCHGSQSLLHFIQLTVTWKNDITDFIPDRQPDFPDKKFEKVTGDPFFVDESVLVNTKHTSPFIQEFTSGVGGRGHTFDPTVGRENKQNISREQLLKGKQKAPALV